MNKKSKLKKATFWPPKLVCVLWCLGMLNFLEKGNWLFAIVQFGLLRLSSKTSEVQTPPPPGLPSNLDGVRSCSSEEGGTFLKTLIAQGTTSADGAKRVQQESASKAPNSAPLSPWKIDSSKTCHFNECWYIWSTLLWEECEHLPHLISLWKPCNIPVPKKEK